MSSMRILLGLILALAATAASAQAAGSLRWRMGGTPLGLQVQPAQLEDSAAWRLARVQGPAVRVVGRVERIPQIGFYGRLGTATLPPVPGWAQEAGTTVGVGLSWDFSQRASATLGWDSYDLQTANGLSRDIRATSLGLRWRY